MAKIVDVPNSGRAAKYVDLEELPHIATLLREHPDQFIGEIIEPQDTVVKARYAKTQWVAALKEHDLDVRARVYTVGPDQYTFALRVKTDAETTEPAKPRKHAKNEDAA